jgi:hypothetical protein
MPTIRQHFFFPPRSWRRQSLLCNGAARQITLRDFVPATQAPSSARAELNLVRELNCAGIVPNSCLNPCGSKKC